MFVFSQFFIRMLKNKAQIARESIKTTLELPWTSAESEFSSVLVMCVQVHVHHICAPPKKKMKILDPPLYWRPNDAKTKCNSLSKEENETY